MVANETLGPAEKVINTLINYSGHAVHNRPGFVSTDASSVVGVKWQYCTHKVEDGKKVVYLVTKGKANQKVGQLWEDGTVRSDDRRKLGRYQKPGIFPEVATWMYQQVADVWALDNEFAARWASFAYPQEHKDLKVILAAFMLVQSRKGDPIRDEDETFLDEDFREVGEAMCLHIRKDRRHLDAKLLMRIHDVLCLDGIAKINRELGFGRSARKPFLGRWSKVVRQWLKHREDNLPLLEGLAKAGFKKTVIKLAKCSGYKPSTSKFYEILGWTQKQADDGRRTIGIGEDFSKEDSWEGLTEEQVCEKIIQGKPSFKLLTGRLPKNMGLTRAIMAAAIEAKSVSDKDLIILTPTLEELGLLKVQDIRQRWETATKQAEDQRAANLARNVKSKELKEQLENAADAAAQKAVEEEVKGIEPYFFVDVSSSMGPAIEAAKQYVEKFVGSFPLDKIHVAIFNTVGREIAIKKASSAGVRQAFFGIRAGGGTSYAAGVKALSKIKPADGTDAIFIFIGDEEDFGGPTQLVNAVQTSGINPTAFGLLRLGNSGYHVVQEAAAALNIPCFRVDEEVFKDPYAIPRTVRALIAATPVGQVTGGVPKAAPRVSLVEQILNTEILRKPAWAIAA